MREWVDTETNEDARALDRSMWDIVGSEQPDGTFIAKAAGPAPEDGLGSKGSGKGKDDSGRPAPY